MILCDRYDEIDLNENALEMIPCLRQHEDGLLYFSSVWLYPRSDWTWKDNVEVEITFGYGWEIKEWMKSGI